MISKTAMDTNKIQQVILTLLFCLNIFLIRQLYFVPGGSVCILGSEFGQDGGSASEYEYSPNLLEYIRKNHLYGPSSLTYNLVNDTDDPMEPSFQVQLTQLLKQTKGVRPGVPGVPLTRALPPDLTGGTFIECGANNGEFLSNTLMLEKNQKWTGILIEANPEMLPTLFSKNRKAFIVDTCLSLTNKPQMLEFLGSKGTSDGEKGMAHINPEKTGEKLSEEHNRTIMNYESRGVIQCFPLLAITQAVKMDHIDFFSLDIEGHELAVLKTLPFDRRLTIDVLTVEYTHIYEGKEALRSFMESKSYSIYFDDGLNFIFVRKELNISPIKSTV